MAEFIEISTGGHKKFINVNNINYIEKFSEPYQGTKIKYLSGECEKAEETYSELVERIRKSI